MRIRDLGVLAVLAIPALTFSPLRASADEVVKAEASSPFLLVFPDTNARFHVTRDMSSGALLFRAADGTTVTKAPVVTLRTASGPKEVVLTAVAADKGSWRVTHELLKSEKFDGTFAVIVGDKTYTTPLVLEPVRVARHGGHLVRMTDCGKNVEIVQDLTTGTITIYCADEVKFTEPILVLSEPKDAGQVKFVAVDGEAGAWRATHATLKTANVDGSLRVMVDGKVCEVPMTFYGTHGGRIVRVNNGPRFELVQDPKTGYMFYALDETIDGKAVVIENPKVTWTTNDGPKTVALTPVENQPRAWRLVGLDGGVTQPGDARLSFTLFGRTLDTALGLSGAGINLR